jgi:acetyltransferase-like isoleucine patch superfamily enzyme
MERRSHSQRRIVAIEGIHSTAVVETDALGSGVTIGEFAVVRTGAVIGDGAVVHPHVVIESGAQIGEETEVLPGCHIGRAPKAVGAISRDPDYRQQLVIGANCSIGANAVIYYDTEIGPETLVGDGASIRELSRVGSRCVVGRGVTLDRDCHLGDGTRVMDKAHLTGNMRIGKDVFISTGVVSTNDSTFGRVVGGEEKVKGPTIEDEASIGAGASLLPGVVIGRGAIVGSGAVVTKDVEPGTLVMGIPARPVSRDH